jgi:hypothetical protein
MANHPHPWEFDSRCKPCWDVLAANPVASLATLRHVNRVALCANPTRAAMNMLELRKLKFSHWRNLSRNPAAIHLLEANPRSIHWKELSRNPAAIHLLEANPSKIHWPFLSANPHAVHMLLARPERIDWQQLSSNTSPRIRDLLRQHPEKIDWPTLSLNPIIFEPDPAATRLAAVMPTVDYAAMRLAGAPFREELMRHCMHPSRLHQAQHHWLLF